jgi:dephospho-CoA kinase
MVREELRQQDKALYATRVITKINELSYEGHNKVVVDGLYTWTEYRAFKEYFGDSATIIAIVAPRNLRHRRLAQRPERPLTEQDASARDYAEIENLEKGGPIANADYTIVNDDTPEKLKTELDRILKEADFLS